MPKERSPCSVVLEGGVTSAVIYASLLQRLSRHYSFKQLGGASSGAVAAAAAAAAEFARQNTPGQPSAPFDALGRFPAALAATDSSGRTALFKLFQPRPGGRRSFRVGMAALGGKSDEGLAAVAVRLVVALLANFWLGALGGALLVVGIAGLVADGLQQRGICSGGLDNFLLCAVGTGVAALAALVAAALALVAYALLVTSKELRGNHWGLCNGMTQSGFCKDTALTPTLHGLLQGLSGLGSRKPLTFADLWGPAPGRAIDLQIVTSAISLARPVRLPGDAGAHPLRGFFYDPLEWEALFPEDVLAHLKAHGELATLQHADGRVLLSLPEPAQWPVLMAVRFSLSFPVLLSAVPMYIPVLRRERDAPPSFEARKVYFSDGGITSNCPVHLFDAPLPGYPTFGVNLYTPRKGQKSRVSRSDTRDPELEDAATPDAAGWTNPAPFLLAIFSTMFGWRDSLQRSLPGYRERIVHIGVPEDAGALNLAMSPDTIGMLSTLGKLGARLLHRDFATPRRTGEANAWERHRWTRTRTMLSALRGYLSVLAGRVPTGQPDYPGLLRTAVPSRYPLQDDRARQQALHLLDEACALSESLEAMPPPGALDQATPQPAPQLRMSPPW